MSMGMPSMEQPKKPASEIKSKKDFSPLDRIAELESDRDLATAFLGLREVGYTAEQFHQAMERLENAMNHTDPESKDYKALINVKDVLKAKIKRFGTSGKARDKEDLEDFIVRMRNEDLAKMQIDLV